MRIDRMPRLGDLFRENPFMGWALALGACALALAVRWGLAGVLPPGFPFLTFFPAVIFTAFVAGTGPGVLCAMLSGLAAWYFFIPPFDSFALSAASGWALGFYAFIVGVDIALVHVMRTSLDHLREEREVSAGLLAQQRILFQELQHRVANNMTFIAALLQLQKRKVLADPSRAPEALDEATDRLETMSRFHRRLYDPASADLPLAAHFEAMCQDLLKSAGARDVVCLVDVPAITMDITRLMTLSLLVAEVVTNSLKHAFADRPGGTISLTLKRLDSTDLELIIRDDGPGLPATYDPGQSKGLGSRIVEGLASQLGGRLTLTSNNGAITRLVIPA